MRRRTFLGSIAALFIRPAPGVPEAEELPTLVSGDLSDYIHMIEPEMSPLLAHMQINARNRFMAQPFVGWETDKLVEQVTGIEDVILSCDTGKLPEKDGIPIGKDDEPWHDATDLEPQTPTTTLTSSAS